MKRRWQKWRCSRGHHDYRDVLTGHPAYVIGRRCWHCDEDLPDVYVNGHLVVKWLPE